MLSLLKLCAYALLGYVLYEMIRGMTDERGRARSSATEEGRQRPAQAVRGSIPAEVADVSGVSHTEYVGRGVRRRQ